MNADDLTKSLKPLPTKQRRRIALPIVAGSLCGVFSGLAVLYGADPDHGKQSSLASVPQPALANSVQQTAAVPAPAPAMPTVKTITLTVIDSQTGARREIVVPASTDDQTKEDKPAPARSTANITPANTAGSPGAAKTKRH